MFYSFTSMEFTNRTDVFATLRALVARLFTSSCMILVIILANWTGLLGKFSRSPR